MANVAATRDRVNTEHFHHYRMFHWTVLLYVLLYFWSNAKLLKREGDFSPSRLKYIWYLINKSWFWANPQLLLPNFNLPTYPMRKCCENWFLKAKITLFFARGVLWFPINNEKVTVAPSWAHSTLSCAAQKGKRSWNCLRRGNCHHTQMLRLTPAPLKSDQNTSLFLWGEQSSVHIKGSPPHFKAIFPEELG